MRIGAVLLGSTLTVLAVGAAGCGGSTGGRVAQLGTTATASGSPSAATQRSGWLAFSGCMRANGVPMYPDPAGNGPPPKEGLQQLGVSSAQFQAAESACRSLLPNGGRPPDQAQRREVRLLGLRFARCMRAHGVPTMPDPDASGRIPDPASVGIDQGSPRFEAANQACAEDRPPYIPSNSAYESWVRTHTGGG